MRKQARRAVWLSILLVILTLTGCNVQNEQKQGVGTKSPEVTQVQQPQETISLSEEVENPKNTSQASSQVTVQFLDVGQGDSIFIQAGNETMLIDAANNKDGKSIVAYLKNQGITKIDYLVGTHPDADHIGGLDNVIRSFEIGTIYMPKKKSTTKTFEDVLLAIKEKGLKIKAPSPGDTFTMGEATFTVIAPNDMYEDNNNNSIVLTMQHGKNRFIFLGDAELDSEEDILQKTWDISATVMKVGHHGSHSSTSKAFLEAINPKYAVISCGVDNKYGHPHKETMTRLKQYDVEVYQTDMQQTIQFTSDGKTLDITTGLPSAEGKKSSDSISGNKNAQDKKEDISDNQGTDTYIGNINSKKFHVAICSSLPVKKNQILFSTRKEAIKDGYQPCGICNP